MPRPISTNSAPEAVWLNVSPGFRRLDRQLLSHLSRQYRVAHWAYSQSPDEPSGLEAALTLLHDYIKPLDRPVHLLGHGTAGLVGWLYAQRFPRRIKSLTLLAVGVNPAIDWQAHYYAQLEFLHCKRSIVLAQMAHGLFGHQSRTHLKGCVQMLEQDLIYSPSPHSLVRRESLCPAQVPVPLLVCGGDEDFIVDPTQLRGWQPWLKPQDRSWLCPEGRHFFQASHAHLVAEEIFDFWEAKQLAALASLPKAV